MASRHDPRMSQSKHVAVKWIAHFLNSIELGTGLSRPENGAGHDTIIMAGRVWAHQPACGMSGLRFAKLSDPGRFRDAV